MERWKKIKENLDQTLAVKAKKILDQQKKETEREKNAILQKKEMDSLRVFINF